MKNLKQETIVNYLKNYGFVFASSEIYGGLANAWDYGPLGVALKNNIKSLWWNYFITSQPSMVGLDSSIILNPQVWKASGHLANFADPLIDCKECHQRFRADKLIEEYLPDVKINENTSPEKLVSIIRENNLKCPACGKSNWTDIRRFNLMFKTYQSVIEDKSNEVYLRPETAQGIFINFANIQRTMRLKVPFGVGQIGKAFRNEITPGNFIFRTREFEQMEIEHFLYPEQAPAKFEEYLSKIENFLLNVIGLNKENIRRQEHDKADLSHYSARTIDFQYNFPHGWSELWGLANRTDFDLSNHEKFSGATMGYLDPETNKRFWPYVVEPSVGVERLFYAIMCNAYDVEDLGNGETREVLRLNYALCPYKVAVLPLSNKLTDQARKVYDDLIAKGIPAVFDVSGSIGKRYRRQDAIGTYHCVTIDFDTEKDGSVTIRDRDTMKQKRIKICDIFQNLGK